MTTVRVGGLNMLREAIDSQRKRIPAIMEKALRKAAHAPASGTGLLQERIKELAARHGSMRAAARVLDVDHAYLSRLSKGEKDNPDDALLRKLNLRRVVTYEDRIRRARG